MFSTLIPTRTRAEQGQGTVEYIGIAVVAAIIISGLLAIPMAPQMSQGLEQVICGIFQKSPFGASGSCAPVTPPQCVVGTNTERKGSEAGVKVVTVSSGQGYTVTEYSDGSMSVTVNDDYSLNGNFGLKDTKLKGNGISLALTASGSYGYGETFLFGPDERDKAEELIKQVQDRTNSNHSYIPVGPAFNDRPEGSDISSHEFSLKGGGDASISLQDLAKGQKTKNGQPTNGSNKEEKPAPGTPSADLGAGANIQLGTKGRYAHNKGEDHDDPSDDTTTYSFAVGFDGNINANAELSAEQMEKLKGVIGGNVSAETMVSVTTDANGQITNMTFTTTAEYGGQLDGSYGAANTPDKTKHGAGTGATGKDSTVIVTQTSIDIKTDEQRAAAADFLLNPDQNPMPFLVSAFPEIGDSGLDLDPMSEMMANNSYVRRNHYDSNSLKTQNDYIVYSNNSEEKSTKLVSSEKYDGSGQWSPDESCNVPQ